MKSLLILIVLCATLPSCGKKSKDNSCKSRETVQLECRTVNQPNYGYHYAQEMCNRTYTADKCY
jgi:hypothetical protein